MSYRKLSDIGGSSEKVAISKATKEVIHVPEIFTKEDKESLIKNNKVVIVDVYADWCHPCQITAPYFAELYDKYKDLCKLVKESVELRLSPTVTVIPTFQIIIDGKLTKQITGADMGAVEDAIKSAL